MSRDVVAALALALGALAGAPVEALAQAGEPFAREVAKCDQGNGSVPLQVTSVLTYTYTNTAAPASQVTEPGFEVCLTWTPTPSVTLFADVTATAPSDSSATLTIDRLYLDLPNTLGAKDLRFRIGRDELSLGPLGLLLNEPDLGSARDGFQMWLPPIGPVHLFGFYQYALDTRSTSRRVWGGRAESEIVSGLTLGANYRADIAAAADTGPCPGVGCATGSGFSVDLDGNLGPGLGLTLTYGNYTQTGDVARGYFVGEVAFDLKELAGMGLHPVLTFSYKDLAPYTIPGADGTVPLGGFMTPDDFKLFDINDNLTAVGANLELALSSNVAFLALGEWGAYKNSGPPYTVYSAGLEFSFPDNISLKLTYNAYAVAGGSVTTSPVSGTALSNTTVYQAELTKTW